MMLPSDRRWAWDGLDHRTAATLLAFYLPPADRDGLVFLGQGDFCLAFRRGTQVVRVARHPEAAAALRREACVLAAIAHELPLSVPRPTYSDPSGCPPFTVHEEVPGAVLTKDIWLRMPTGARGAAAGDLAIFLRALHTLPTDAALECGLKQMDASEFARALRGAASGDLYPLLGREMRRKLDDVLMRWSAPTRDEPPPPALLHCDIAPGHLLYDESSGCLTGVIDFGDIAVGEPARDFIHIYEDYGSVILADVLSRYSDDGASHLMPEIRKWYLLEAISWTLDMVARRSEAEIRHGLAEIGRELAEPAI